MQGKWNLIQIPEILTSQHKFLDGPSAFMITGWFILQCLLYLLPVGGPISQGVELKCSRRLNYRLNGESLLFTSQPKSSRKDDAHKTIQACRTLNDIIS